MWFRHAKAGELCERFAELHLIEGDPVTAVVPTYRGEGRRSSRVRKPVDGSPRPGGRRPAAPPGRAPGPGPPSAAARRRPVPHRTYGGPGRRGAAVAVVTATYGEPAQTPVPPLPLAGRCCPP